MRGCLAIVEHKREEARFNGALRKASPQPITQVLHENAATQIISKPIWIQPEQASTPTPAEPLAPVSFLPDVKDERVKVYPILAFAAIKNNQGGAYRAWLLARHIDEQGSGSVTRKELTNTLKKLGVNKFQRSRWLSAAMNSGLFKENRGTFYLAGLGKAAYIFHADAVGMPALVDTRSICSTSWHARMWSAYLCTLNDKLISQETKAKITGVHSRTQRNYQSTEPGTARGNYARTKLQPDQIQGMMETEGGVYLETQKGQVIQRLPDIRNVPLMLASPAQKGRSRKAQKVLNFLSKEGQENEATTRLFCESPKQLKATERKLAYDDRLPYNKPRELYSLAFRGRSNNLWDTLSLGGLYQ